MEKCPVCGFQEPTKNKPITNEMYHYVDPKTGKVDGVYNANSEELTLSPKGKPAYTVVRADKYAERKAAAATPVKPAPVANPTAGAATTVITKQP